MIAGYLRKKISSLASSNELFPMNINWKKQEQSSLNDAWKEITNEYDLSGIPDAHVYINDCLNKHWRNNKTTLKADYVNRYPERFDAEILESLPNEVDRRQFSDMLTYWRSEDGKAKYEQNKKNRVKQMNHHAGAKGFAQRSYASKQKGLSEDEARVQILREFYPEEETVKNVLKYIESEEGKEFAENEGMSLIYMNTLSSVSLERTKKIATSARVNDTTSRRFMTSQKNIEDDTDTITVPKSQLDTIMRRVDQYEKKMEQYEEQFEVYKEHIGQCHEKIERYVQQIVSFEQTNGRNEFC